MDASSTYRPGGEPERSTRLRTATRTAQRAKAPTQMRRCARPIPAFGSPTRRVDEVDEEATGPLALDVQLLGVALHADNEPPSRVLNPLDETVGSAGADHELACEIAHRLMVHAVHAHDVSTDDPVQARRSSYLDVVGQLPAPARRIVVVVGGSHGDDVLPEGPAERHVEQLGTPADREQRLVRVESPAHQQHLGTV